MTTETKIVVWTTVISVVLLIYGVIRPPYNGSGVPSEVKKFLSIERKEIDLRQVSLNL